MLDNKGYKDTHTKYVTILAFLRQQWLSERACMWLYTYATFLNLLLLAAYAVVNSQVKFHSELYKNSYSVSTEFIRNET
jgi:hypothetical protein